MNPVHLAIAAVPVAVYLLLIGVLRLRRRPLVTTGWRDTLTLGLALTGLVMIGPMQLFFPMNAAARLHSFVWVALLSLYFLSLLLFVLSRKPSLIAYGMDAEQFREALLSAARSEDEGAYWSGNVLTLPVSGLQLAMEASKSETVHQVVHVGSLVQIHSWLRLERNFVQLVKNIPCSRHIAGWPYLISGCAILIYATIPLISNPAQALAQLVEFIDR